MGTSFVLFLFLHDLPASETSKQTKSSLEKNFASIVTQVDLSDKSETKKPASNHPSEKEKSLTLSFIEDLNQEIASQNPGGARTIDGEVSLVAPNEISVKDFAVRNSELIDWRNFIPEISDKDIKVTSNNSAKEYTKYLNSLYGVLREILAATSTTKVQPEQKDYSWAATEMVNKYEVTIQAVYALSVPIGLKEFHKKEIALLTAQKNIYQKVATGKKDPLSALIAMQANKKIDDEFKSLKQELKVTIEKTL